MVADLAPEIKPPASAEAKPAVPSEKLRQDFNEAARIGQGLLGANRERETEGYSFSFNTEMFPVDYLAAVTSRKNTEQITEEHVRAARRASFGLTLEAARQIKEGGVNRTGRINDELENLEAIYGYLAQGADLSEELTAKDNEGFLSVSKTLVARQLGVKLEEVKMDSTQLQAWVKENYQAARGQIEGKIEALRSYFSR